MLKIVGDINFTDGYFDVGFGVGSLIREGANPFEKLKRTNDDYWIGNFECVCAESSNKQGTSAKQFIISPNELSHINHLNLYGVANNHVMQHGGEAYNQMLANLISFGSNYFGADAKRVHTFEHQGKQISIMGFNQRPENFSCTPLYWAMPEYWEISKEFEKISDVDYKIAYIHWGNEFINYPYNDQRQFAHYLIDLGFDLIVGMHPHVIQGFEVYKSKYIFYSLGNCVFNMAWYATKYSVMVTVDFNRSIPQVGYKYLYLDNCFPHEVDEAVVPIEWRFTSLNEKLCVQQLPENEKYYRQVFKALSQNRKANRLRILKTIYKLSFTDFLAILKDFINRKVHR